MIQFKGNKFRYTQVDDTLVLFLSKSPVVAKDFLGKDITVGGKTVTVFETTDPYRPPYVEDGHKNAGMFAELRFVEKGQEVPKQRDTNVEVPTARGRKIGDKVVRK